MKWTDPARGAGRDKVIVTNKRLNPRKVVLFHEGRGSQEGIFAVLKTHCRIGYVPVNTRVGNQLYMFAGSTDEDDLDAYAGPLGWTST